MRRESVGGAAGLIVWFIFRSQIAVAIGYEGGFSITLIVVAGVFGGVGAALGMLVESLLRLIPRSTNTMEQPRKDEELHLALNGDRPYCSRTFQTQDELLAWAEEQRVQNVAEGQCLDLTPTVLNLEGQVDRDGR